MKEPARVVKSLLGSAKKANGRRAGVDNGAGPVQPLEGGKALARLRYTEQLRGIATSEVAPTPARGRTSAPFEVPLADKGPSPEEVGKAYLAAFKAKAKLDAKTDAKTNPAVPVPIGWRPLGPFAVPHGQTYGSGPGSRPSIAGRVSAIAVDPSDPAHILVGAGGGGVWASRDTGATWTPITDGQPTLATGAIAFAPNDATRVYAGTGEGNFYAPFGVGVLVSNDGGNTWTLQASGTFAGRGFYRIVVHPLNRDQVVAGTTGGLYTTANGGGAWTQRRAVQTWDVSIQSPTPGLAANAFEVLAACTDGVFRSTDSGATWAAVALPGALASYQRIAVAHAPSNPNVAYVLAADSSTVRIWRRAAMGGAFTAVTPPAGLGAGQAWYDWFAGVAPNNPDVLYVGGVDAYRGELVAGTWTWTAISAKSAGDSIHPDQHTIAFTNSDPNVVYVGNDGGVFRSPDRGTTWRSLNKNLAIAEFEYLAQHPQYDAWLLGGTQDNGTLRYEGAEVWFHIDDGDGGDCGVNQATPYTCFHSYYNLGFARSTSGGGWGSWTWIPVPPVAGASSLFYPPFEANGSTVCQAGNQVYLSRDNGTTFDPVITLPNADVASALAMPTPQRVYVGATAGRVYRIDFVGGAWQAPVNVGTPRAGVVSDILVDPTNANRIWATYSSFGAGQVFRTDNGGTNWVNAGPGLPAIPAHSVEVDPANPNTVFVAMDVGVFRSNNAGAAWFGYSNGLPNAIAKDLLFHGPTRLLRVGFQSRGVWEIPVDAGTMQDVEVYVRDSRVDTGRRTPSPSGSDPFNQGANTWWWQCTDIKVDSPPYQTAAPSDVDFVGFEDDHGVFASGLIDEGGATQRNRVARVYVQVHNRGVNPAQNVAVKVFYADASVALPDLPAGFWTNFPNNVLPAASPWQAIGAHKVVPLVPTGRGQIVEFDWTVPGTAAGHTCLLAVISAANDQINTTELNIGTLVTGDKKAGLKNLGVINPPPAIGPRLHALVLNAWPTERARTLTIGGDKRLLSLVRGIVVSKHMAEYLEKFGFSRAEVDEETQGALDLLLKQNEGLADRLDLSAVHAPPRAKLWLEGIPFPNGREEPGPEPLVLILEGKAKAGEAAILQYGEEGEVVGGFTLRMAPATKRLRG
ncbi:MAG TPA: hypothetical protein VGO92_02410 [Acidimicrobiales bacterium]|jgi:photosystem II stability/assembly factor-like uncharacterized protein|nr:hypothetical protein [Acidimicrobiales bacterium]